MQQQWMAWESGPLAHAVQLHPLSDVPLLSYDGLLLGYPNVHLGGSDRTQVMVDTSASHSSFHGQVLCLYQKPNASQDLVFNEHTILHGGGMTLLQNPRYLRCDSPISTCYKLHTTSPHSLLQTIPQGLPDHVAKSGGLFAPRLGCATYVQFLPWAPLKAGNLSCHLVPSHGICYFQSLKSPPSILPYQCQEVKNATNCQDQWIPENSTDIRGP